MLREDYKINQTIGEEDLDQIKIIQEGVRLQVKLNKLKGAPIARFDPKSKKAYLEYPDGRKEFGLEP